jgi:hypothetical protein
MNTAMASLAEAPREIAELSDSKHASQWLASGVVGRDWQNKSPLRSRTVPNPKGRVYPRQKKPRQLL